MATRRRADQSIGADDVFAPPDLDALGTTHYGTVWHMADMKALFTQRFDAARAALTAGDEPAAAESLHAAIVVARNDPGLRRELASALFHLGKLSRKFGRAGEAEAETLLTEALAISEGFFGREHVALTPLLNELGRLHIHRSQHARAEDVLERLLAIARGKSEENADVATVLAALAVVKRKLGDDASAEALFRDALRIREKVLEPNHMVTVVTLEHLSETCAARGNFAEALALLRRGLATREVALGPGHATVQVARSRVTELELQVAVAADTAAADAVKAARRAVATPAWFKRVPDYRADTPSTTAPSRINSKTPTVTAVVAAASLMASSIQTPSASQIVISPPESARPSGSVSGRESGAPQRDAVLEDVAHNDVATDDAALGDWQSTIAPIQTDSPEPARKKRTVLYLSAGVAAVAIMVAGLLMFRPRAGGGDPVSTKMSAARRTTAAVAPVVPPPATRTGSIATGAAAMVAATGAESLPSASATPAPIAPAAKPEQQKAPESDTLRLPRVNVHLARINIPSIPVPSISAVSSVDSIARSATERQRASDTARTEMRDEAARPTSADVDNRHTAPKIIGRVPELVFPEALLRSGHREGQVVVRFMVNELERVDVASMIVERSDHELFTAAVRNVLPRFRFEPAHTLAPDSKPVAVWVSVPFRFTTKK
ncbi:MAG TPA: tetratricopeptide repeat protein [Gemmatimonadaceae bacterium]|nr:tetratricopeptide repeat protein [Gemmatimonadaceae bacterium]